VNNPLALGGQEDVNVLNSRLFEPPDCHFPLLGRTLILPLISTTQLSNQFLFPITFSMTAMEELDGDTVRLSSRGRYAERDIVQVKSHQFTCYLLIL